MSLINVKEGVASVGHSFGEMPAQIQWRYVHAWAEPDATCIWLVRPMAMQLLARILSLEIRSDEVLEPLLRHCSLYAMHSSFPYET